MKWVKRHWRWIVLVALLLAAGVIGLATGEAVMASFAALLGGGAIASDKLERWARDRHARARRQAASTMAAAAGRAKDRVEAADEAARKDIDDARHDLGSLGGWIADKNRRRPTD